MKTWEMIKKLSENSNSLFKMVKHPTVTATVSENGFFILRCGENEVHNSGNMKILGGADEWELVCKSIDFITAVRAFHDGKKITCRECKSLGIGTRTYDPDNAEYEHCLIDTRNESVSSYEILNGKWYIED